MQITDLRWHTCTAGDPWRSDMGKRGAHPDAAEIGEQEKGYPSGDRQRMRCPHCRVEWTQELPQ
jgi:hypothetical protein